MPKRTLVLAVIVSAAASALAWDVLNCTARPPATDASGGTAPTLTPLVGTPPAPELALLMGTLQTLIHKLALSADAGNAKLAQFYAHESIEQLRAIQGQAPEYENLPVSVLIERMALPAFSDLQNALGEPAPPREALLAGVDRVIQSCNACHVTTQRSFIRITRGTGVNPFNQAFDP